MSIADDGRTTQDWVPGIGLRSMRERAEELGGSLQTTADDDGGQVQATYPLVTVS